MEIICNYCGERAELISGGELFPFFPGLENKWFYVCYNCDARVGCHKGTKKPLGSLANEELRNWRKNAHKAFDKTWKGRNKRMKRKDAYYKLSIKLDIPLKDCHIGLFNVDMCKKVVEVCNVAEY